MKKHIMALTLAFAMSTVVISEPVFALDNETVDLESEGIQESDGTQETSTVQDIFETIETSDVQDSIETLETSITQETIETLEANTVNEDVETYNDDGISAAKEIEIKEMHRLYNPNSGEHFYTSDINEKNHLVNVGWKYEGIGWKAPAEGNQVYRLYNPNAGDHHYTLSEAERDYLVSVGWNYEGIGWCSDSKNTVPIFRVYNPNAVTGTHHYTANYSEIEHLISVGWNYEGVGWYSCDSTWTDSVGEDERIEIDNIREDEGLFDVKVYLNRSSNSINKVYVPVWTKTDKSDMKWYVADRQSDGSYKATVDAINHQWNSGRYNVHVYIQKFQGEMVWVNSSYVDIQLKEPVCKVNIEDHANGKFTINIYGVYAPYNVKNVRVPVWSDENGQDDIIWYVADLKDNVATLTVNGKNHKYSTGKYNIHIYYEEENGDLHYINETEYYMKEGVLAAEPHVISGFPLIYQYPELPTGCEVVSLTMALRFYGYSVGKTTMASTYLPQTSYTTYYGADGKLYGPDLDNYFVGDPFGSGTICGPGALVTAANSYLTSCGSSLRAKDITGASFDEMYMRVSKGQPVVVMTTIGMENRRPATGWYTTSGKYVDWSRNDHGSVLIGWNESSVTIACPIYGIGTYSKQQFEKVVASRGYRVMVLE